jgi:hypothetical protein
MTLRFGFELEGFCSKGRGENTEIVIPPNTVPVDGFPGLIEARTTGGGSLSGQLATLVTELVRIQTELNRTDLYFEYGWPSFKFSGEQMQFMRKTRRFDKRQVDIQNVYGKSPRRYGNKSLASFQINISNHIGGGYQTTLKNDVKYDIPNQYGLLDIRGIVTALDKEFAQEIKDTDRQPGMFAIKDYVRLEYRSLPNFVFEREYERGFAKRLEKVFKPWL